MWPECPVCFGTNFAYEQDSELNGRFSRLVLVCQDCGHSLGDEEDEMEHEIYRANHRPFGRKVRYG